MIVNRNGQIAPKLFTIMVCCTGTDLPSSAWQRSNTQPAAARRMGMRP